MERDAAIGLTSIFGFISIFVSSFLLGYSFDTLHPQKMALMYNQNTGRLMCDKVYGATNDDHGRFFTGLGIGFYDYRFPRTVQNALLHSVVGADAPIIEGKTYDGINVKMGIAFQYKLKNDPTSLCSIVKNYGVDGYRQYYINYARGAARDALGTFQTFDLWRNRPQVAAAVETAVGNAINARWADFINLQLLTLDIPDSIQLEIENTTVQYQRIYQVALDQSNQQVQAVTRQLQAQLTSQINVISAYATANSTLTLANARADTYNFTYEGESQGYAYLKNALNLNNEQLLGLMWIDAVKASKAKNITIQIESPPVLH